MKRLPLKAELQAAIYFLKLVAAWLWFEHVIERWYAITQKLKHKSPIPNPKSEITNPK